MWVTRKCRQPSGNGSPHRDWCGCGGTESPRAHRL